MSKYLCDQVCVRESMCGLVCVNGGRVLGGAAEGENLVIFCISLIISFTLSTDANRLPTDLRLHQTLPGPQDGSDSNSPQASASDIEEVYICHANHLKQGGVLCGYCRSMGSVLL